MNGGYGGAEYGLGPYGGPVSAFGVSSVSPIDYRTIDIKFSSDLSTAPDNLALIASVGSYDISPSLQVIAVVITDPDTLRVFTLPQSPGATYRVEVIADLRDTFNQILGSRVGTWVALAAPSKVFVSNLNAQSECQGKAIHLTWSNPAGATQTKIVRRLKAWPFDLTDSHDVVYEGDPISGFVDIGFTFEASALLHVASSVPQGPNVISVDYPNGVPCGWVIGDTVRLKSLDGLWEDAVIASFPASFSAPRVQFTEPLSRVYEQGAQIGYATPLQAQTYYYYLVLVSDDAGPSYLYDIDDPARIFALSIDVFDGKSWWSRNTPAYALQMDGVPAAQGGGDGFLDKWFTVMGCWLNTMRGQLNALSLTNDPDRTPFHTLVAKNQALGIDPEGFAYDFDVVRRPISGSLVYVYHQRGTCPGIVETVRMFTKWDAQCLEFGFNQCQGGAGNIQTWDGVSQLEYGDDVGLTQLTIEVTSPEGAARLVDPTKTWEDSLWEDGLLLGWMGDVACVENNTEDTLILRAPRIVTTIAALVSPGDTVISVATTDFVPGMTVQLIATDETYPGSGVYHSEIVEILSITPGSPGSITIHRGVEFGYFSGSNVTIGKSIIRREVTGTSTATGQVLTDASALWTENQWVGYKVLDSDNVLHDVVSNTGTTVTVDGAAPPAGPSDYAIAFDFMLGATWADRVPSTQYRVSNDVQSTLFNPILNLALRGTVYDPFNRIYNGVGAVLTGGYGPDDVAALILTKVPVGRGQGQMATGFTFNLDPSQPAPAIDEWKGYFLNPNQNQEQLFEILANDATTLTVAGAVSSLVVEGQYYYVLMPRDKVRFERLTHRLRKEFTDADVRIHVLFA